MSGTVILTGANGSAGLHASEHLLRTYPETTAIFLVRSAAETDVNTNTLRNIISRYPDAKATIYEVDLANLTAVHDFASTISTDITAGKYPPLKSIICTASYWNLISDPELTVDGYDKTFQIGFLAHAALVLRLLDSFGPEGGRIELSSSVAHYRRKTPMSAYLPEIPGDLDTLVRPEKDKDVQGRGFQRYASMKLALTSWCFALGRFLGEVSLWLSFPLCSCKVYARKVDEYCMKRWKQRRAAKFPLVKTPTHTLTPTPSSQDPNPKLNKITAIAQNPGDMLDSRVFRTNTPRYLQLVQKFVMQPLMPVLRRLVDPTWRPAKEAAVDMVDLAVSVTYKGTEGGYYTVLKKDDPDPVVRDEETQRRVWVQTAKWAGITGENCVLKNAFE
jgi:NAD(P)-dependent dehydrogenase (short-subunit alcohol dehydrogenase family)